MNHQHDRHRPKGISGEFIRDRELEQGMEYHVVSTTLEAVKPL